MTRKRKPDVVSYTPMKGTPANGAPQAQATAKETQEAGQAEVGHIIYDDAPTISDFMYENAPEAVDIPSDWEPWKEPKLRALAAKLDPFFIGGRHAALKTIAAEVERRAS